MDTTKTTHVSLCAGYGGIDLGLHQVVPRLVTVAACEIEAFAVANLVSKMEAGLLDPCPVWPNLKTFPWASFHRRVRILSGGYPCQPFSAAGKRLGSDDPRHLWPFIRDGIRLMQPDVVFFENVDGHISLGLREVLTDLARLGYRVEGVRGEPAWGVFSASEVGAPHQRKRVFVLAHRIGSGLEGLTWHGHGIREPGRVTPGPNGSTGAGGVRLWPSGPNQRQHGWEPPRTVANRHSLHRRPPAEGWVDDGQAGPAGEVVHSGRSERRQEAKGNGHNCGQDGEWTKNSSGACEPSELAHPSERHSERGSPRFGRGFGCEVDDSGAGSSADEWRHTQPPLGGDPHGTSHRLDHAKLHVSCDSRVDELRLLGNGVVPATAARAFTVLMRRFLP